MAAAIITQERLKELLRYDPETGTLVWLATRCSTAKVGDVAGCIKSNGYIVIGIDYRMYLVHRLAWFYMTGEWPADQIDHIDGNPSNNRWDNLRKAMPSENAQNRRKAPSSKKSCGLLGAYWDASRQQWRAGIRINGKKRNLGRFLTKELAHAAYIEAKRRFHPFGTL